MSAKKRKRSNIFLLVLIVFAIYIYWENNSLDITRFRLSYEDLPDSFDGYRIVQISDMHGKTFGAKNVTLANKIKALKPDILIATGDMMSSTVDDGQAFLDFLDCFGNYCPVYMCLGNHEQIVRWLNSTGNVNINYNYFINEVEKRGVILLDNSRTELKKGDDSISLDGLTLELYHYSRRDQQIDENLFLTTSYINQVIGKPAKEFTILLAHNPAYFKEYAKWGADLVLSGHVHGGVIRIPFKGGLLSPEKVFFPEYDAGLFEEGKSKMIVNRGLGYSQINFRLFNRPEISFIELNKQ